MFVSWVAIMMIIDFASMIRFEPGLLGVSTGFTDCRIQNLQKWLSRYNHRENMRIATTMDIQA